MTDLGDFSNFSREQADADEGADADTVAETGADAGTDAAADSTTNNGTGSTDDFERVSVDDVGRDRGIGTLSASAGLMVSEDERDTCLKAYVTVSNRTDVRIGSYLVAQYPDGAAGAANQERTSGHADGERLFCRITALEYAQEFQSDDATEIHARRAMRSRGIDEQDYKFMATLDPVAVLYEQDGELRRRMTDRVPKPETVVRQATDATEIKTGLKMPEEGVFLGHLAVGGQKVRTAAEPPTIDYRLKDDYDSGDPLVFRHTLVAGGTGSGKTHAAKNVLRQYLGRTYEMSDGRSPATAVVQFDPQDEYAQMHDDNPDVTAEDETRYEREGIRHGGYDDTVAFVPKVGDATYAASHHRARQVEFTVPFSMVRDNPWLVAGSSLNDNQYGALMELLNRFFRQHGDSGTYREFTSFLDDPGLKEELDESGRVHEATYDAVKRRVFGFNDVFDQDAPALTDQIHEFVRPGGLTVVPTYHISSARAKEAVVLAASSLLIDQKLSNDPRYDRIKDTPLVVGMDEAHNFLTDAESVQARKVISKFTEAAKQGRKERLGLFLITQDPQDIADPVFKQVNTTVVLNLGDEDAIRSVNIPATLESKVPYMEKGQMVVYSPDNSEPVEIIGLSNCLTRHGRD
ncbi:ATP-binding protein [Halomarina litorea]|uniref:ATP-binding protein n=1 Tax=Halomarina litorea TaxID=2961595 RepID=UPI0020C57BB0|nr:ATP-binding protein [Halomarina sp. BCD28]